jgi:hypothetical protein
MRLALTMLVVAGALAGLFVTASREHQRVAERLSVVVISAGNCSASPLTPNIICSTHEQAERVRARFASSWPGVSVHGRTVLLPIAQP